MKKKWYRIILDNNGLGYRVDVLTLSCPFWTHMGLWYDTIYEAKRYILKEGIFDICLVGSGKNMIQNGNSKMQNI